MLRQTVVGLIFLAFLVGCGGTGGVVEQSSAQAGSGSNSSLSLSGQPRTAVVVGQAYSFQPVATSPSSAAGLTFSARNLPAWLRLDPATGRLSGTPSSSDIATYSGLTIAASDGVSSATLGPFSIAVVATGAGTASISWAPPTFNTDGTALTDLAGYVVIYGESEQSLGQSITIDNPSISTYVVENLPSGTWYFAVQAVNGSGVRSSNSAVVSKTIS